MEKPTILLPIFILFFVLPSFAQEIYINEAVAVNTIFYDNYGETEDWLELYNASSEAVNLNGYYLSDEADELEKWQITTDIIIPSEGFSLFWLDNDVSQGANHASFKLSKDGETLFLSKELGGELIVINTLASFNLPKNTSYGREENGGTTLTKFWLPTPLFSNTATPQLSEDTVLFSLASGAYPFGTSINLSSTNNSTDFYYTTDGTRPDETSNAYNEAIPLEDFLYLRVIAVDEDEAFSQIFDAFYIEENLHDLPVIHIGMDLVNLTGEDWGMHVRGNNGVPGSCDTIGANWHCDWERDLDFLWLENGESIAAQAEIKIAGGCSRNMKMKSLIVDFKPDEGLSYPFFKNSEVNTYHKLKLRGSGQDFTRTHLRDGVIQETLKSKTEIDLMDYRPVVVYIGGKYFGIYNAREVMDENYIATHHGINKDELDIIKRPFHATAREVSEGDDIAFNKLINFVENNDLKEEEHFRTFEKMVDLENLTDYLITEIFVANYDWPVNNMTLWRERKEDAKWRWMLYDLDASSNHGIFTNSNPYYNSWEHVLEPTAAEPEGTTFIADILKNERYQAEFLQRMCSFAQLNLSEERVHQVTDSIITLLADEMPQHIDFWSGRPGSWGVGTAVGGSIEAWQERITRFKDFFSVRFQVFSDIFVNQGIVAGKFNLTFDFDENSGGKVVLHQNETPVPYNYTGEYFNLLPLYIKAVPDLGYEFAYWVETDNREDKLIIRADKDIDLTPIFRKKRLPYPTESIALNIFPNPASSYLIIDYFSNKEEVGTLKLINDLGQEILKEEVDLSTELKVVEWDISNLATGIYFLILENEDNLVTKKVVLDR